MRAGEAGATVVTEPENPFFPTQEQKRNGFLTLKELSDQKMLGIKVVANRGKWWYGSGQIPGFLSRLAGTGYRKFKFPVRFRIFHGQTGRRTASDHEPKSHF